MGDENRCGTCRHWSRIEAGRDHPFAEDSDGAGERGECRARPPGRTLSEFPLTLNRWILQGDGAVGEEMEWWEGYRVFPITGATDGCGEWQRDGGN